MTKKIIVIDDKEVELSRFADVVRIISNSDKNPKGQKIRQSELAECLTNLDEERKLSSEAARQYISRIENYALCPSPIRAKAIMKYLDIDVDFILQFEIPEDVSSRAYKSGMTRIEEIFRQSDAELIERVVSYAEYLYERG